MFFQTANNCSQKQTRTVQEREQNTLTDEIRNKGFLLNEERTLSNVIGERDSIGILDCTYDPEGYYWREDTSEWEIFFENVYATNSAQSGGINIREVNYNSFILSRGALKEGLNYEVCSYPYY